MPPKILGKKRRGSGRRTMSRPKRKVEEYVPAPWQQWKSIFFVGTEMELYQTIFDFDWNFDHLEECLTSGALSGRNDIVHLFGLTEPQLLDVDPSNPDEQNVILVPIVVAVCCAFPLPEKVSITSIMRPEEEVVPMSKLKMGYLPFQVEDSWRLAGSSVAHGRRGGRSSGNDVRALQCSQRRRACARLPTMRQKDFEYAIPYIYVPKLDEPPEVQTEVMVVTTIEGSGVNCQFDWDFDEMEEFVPETLTSHGIATTEANKAALTAAVSAKVEEAKGRVRAERRARKERLEALDPAMVDAMNNLQTFKFYPQNKEFSLLKCTSYINRYLGRATHLFPKQEK